MVINMGNTYTISNINIGYNTYLLKDAVARQEIDGATITANYTSATETLEISFTKGSVNNG